MSCTFEQAVVEHCAPTLAGIKPASLFCFCKTDLAEIRRLAGRLDQKLASLGVRVRILKECPERRACIVYVYRPACLGRLLKSQPIRSFLGKFGYPDTGLDNILSRLSGRLRGEKDFPHEIGVFLGYPLEDVVGFIENRGRNFTCCGCWKSYGDPETAQRRFARYRACTAAYKEMHGNGTPIIQLVVAA